MGLFNNRPTTNGKTGVPVWFMRQAGRYHDHYQNLKKSHQFMELCKQPELALETTMGPIREFKFDAAILFSDLLFPLEYLGLGLEYAPGPKLGKKLLTVDDVKNLTPQGEARDFFDFQKKACQLLKQNLPETTTLLGFVGAPFTLYSYGVEGSHSGNLTESKKGLFDGRFDHFYERLKGPLLDEMIVQAEGGADGMCLFDTAVGELTLADFKEFIVPKLREVTGEFKKKYPDVKVVYYSKLTHIEYLRAIECDSIDVLGIDWRMSLPKALSELGNDYYIQGNFDPSYLHFPWPLLEKKLDQFADEILSSNLDLSKWICGLGHGVLQHTPQENVRMTVEYIHKKLLY